MENKTSPKTEEAVGQTVKQARQPSRRTFLNLAVAASGGAALWSVRKPSASAADCGMERGCSLYRDSSQVLIFRREPG